jgi:hypothetical protein
VNGKRQRNGEVPTVMDRDMDLTIHYSLSTIHYKAASCKQKLIHNGAKSGGKNTNAEDGT